MLALFTAIFLMFSGFSEAGELWTKYDLPYSIDCMTNYGNYVWVGTQNGLIKLSRLDGATKIFTKNDGLPTNKITSVCTDNDGNIYISLQDSSTIFTSNSYIYYINSNSEKLIDYTEIAGLRSDQFYDGQKTIEEVPVICLDRINNNIYVALNVQVSKGNGKLYIISVLKFDGASWLNVYNRSLPFPGRLETQLFIYNLLVNPYNLAYPFTVITNDSQGKLKNVIYDKTGEWDIYFSSNYVDYIEGLNKTRYTTENSSLSGIVNVMSIDNTYTKWFGCNNKTSLVSFDDVSWRSYKHADWNDDTIIKLLNIDEDNDVWVVTSNPSGLYRLNPAANTSVESAQQSPTEFTISAAYPNPFNAQTTISFTFTKPSKVNLSIYSLTGQKVRELSAGNYIAGKHTAVWDSKNEKGEMVSSGLYLARMESGGVCKVVRMAMVK